MKKLSLLIIPMLLLLISSCSKDAQDGSAVIWFGESTSQQLVANGVTSLTYRVNGELVGSSAANVYYFTTPDCGQNASITYSKEPGSYAFTVKDQAGVTYWEGTADLTDGGCEAIELTF
jgi:hypothetical protein